MSCFKNSVHLSWKYSLFCCCFTLNHRGEVLPLFKSVFSSFSSNRFRMGNCKRTCCVSNVWVMPNMLFSLRTKMYQIYFQMVWDSLKCFLANQNWDVILTSCSQWLSFRHFPIKLWCTRERKRNSPILPTEACNSFRVCHWPVISFHGHSVFESRLL